VNQLAPRLLRPLIGRRQFERVLRTPDDALRPVLLVLALIAHLGHLRRRIDGDRAEIARLDAPRAAVAALRVHVDDARLRILRQRVARAGDDARRVLAGAARHRRDQNLVHANRADAAAVRVVLPRLGVRANILAQLAADALLRVARNVGIFGC